MSEMNIVKDGHVFKEMEVFKFLGSLVTIVGGVEADVPQIVL